MSIIRKKRSVERNPNLVPSTIEEFFLHWQVAAHVPR